MPLVGIVFTPIGLLVFMRSDREHAWNGLLIPLRLSAAATRATYYVALWLIARSIDERRITDDAWE